MIELSPHGQGRGREGGGRGVRSGGQGSRSQERVPLKNSTVPGGRPVSGLIGATVAVKVTAVAIRPATRERR